MGYPNPNYFKIISLCRIVETKSGLKISTLTLSHEVNESGYHEHWMHPEFLFGVLLPRKWPRLTLGPVKHEHPVEDQAQSPMEEDLTTKSSGRVKNAILAVTFFHKLRCLLSTYSKEHVVWRPVCVQNCPNLICWL